MKYLNDGEDGPQPTNFRSKMKEKLDPKKKKKIQAAKSGVANKLKQMLMERGK